MFLVKTLETYRVNSEAEVDRVIEEAKKDGRFELLKYEAVKKNKKQKGEIIDEWIRLTLHKGFNEEPEPTSTIDVVYNVSQGAFPDPIEKNEDNEEVDW